MGFPKREKAARKSLATTAVKIKKCRASVDQNGWHSTVKPVTKKGKNKAGAKKKGKTATSKKRKWSASADGKTNSKNNDNEKGTPESQNEIIAIDESSSEEEENVVMSALTRPSRSRSCKQEGKGKEEDGLWDTDEENEFDG